MSRTLERSTPALARQRFVAVASTLAFAACGDERPVEPATYLGEETLFAEQSDALALEAGPYTQYVALGDSFTSGFGLAGTISSTIETKGNDCARDLNAAWPPLVNNALGIANPLIFPACSGATTVDVLGSGLVVRSQFQPPPQIEEIPLPPLDTTLITVQIGGNDIKYDSTFATCAQAVEGMQDKPLSPPPECKDVNWLIDNTTEVVNGNLARRLDETFQAIRDAAPEATIVAVGYPHLVDATSACDNQPIGWVIDRNTRQRFNEVGDAINAQIARAAANAGILSLTQDVVQAFSGHEACSPDEWISTLLMHPNAAGHRAYAQVVANGVPAAPRRIGVVNDGAEPPTDSVPSDEGVGEEEVEPPPPAGEEEGPAPGWEEQPPPAGEEEGPAPGWEEQPPPPEGDGEDEQENERE
jgi:lysophospholipase L1-like esterase